MHSYSLAESPSSVRFNQQISYSQVTKEYLEKQSDKLIDTLNELIEESDPKQKYAKLVANRAKELNQLTNQNRKLFEKNRQLEEKLKEAQSEIKRLNNLLPNHENKVRMEFQSPQSGKSNSSSSDQQFSRSDQNLIQPQHQKEKMKGIQMMQQQAKDLENTQKEAIRKCMALMQITFEKLNRMIEFEKVSPSAANQGIFGSFERKETMVVEKEKYEKLIDYYVNSVTNKPIKSANQEDVQQFSVQNYQISGLSEISSLLTASNDLQKLFAQLAHQHNLEQQWKQFLDSKKEEAQKFKQEICYIIKGKNIQKEKINKNIDLINTTISKINDDSTRLNNNQSVTKTNLNIITGADGQIEDILFKKLTNLVNKLEFTQSEKQQFKKVNEKRKYGRLLDIDEILQKIKTSQDVTEISEEYSLLMMRVINSILFKTMELLCQQPIQSGNNILIQSPLKWFKQKLDDKFNPIKKRLFEIIQKQVSLYLSEKHQYLNYSNQEKLKNRKIVNPFNNPKFDKDKSLEKELLKIVYQYRQLIKSSIINTNKKLIIEVC